MWHPKPIDTKYSFLFSLFFLHSVESPINPYSFVLLSVPSKPPTLFGGGGFGAGFGAGGPNPFGVPAQAVPNPFGAPAQTTPNPFGAPAQAPVLENMLL